MLPWCPRVRTSFLYSDPIHKKTGGEPLSATQCRASTAHRRKAPTNSPSTQGLTPVPVRPLQSPACSASRWEAGEAKAIDDKVIKAPKKTAVMILRFISRILLVTSRRADDTATRLIATMLANDPQRVLEGLADFLDVLALVAAGTAVQRKCLGVTPNCRLK